MFKLFETSKEKERIYIGRISQKIGNKYIVTDKKSRQYSVRSTLPFKVGTTVLIKGDLILNAAKDPDTFTHVLV